MRQALIQLPALLLATILLFSACGDSTTGSSASSAQEQADVQRQAQEQAEEQRQAREQAEAQRLAEQKAEEEKARRQQEAYRTAINALLQSDAQIDHSYTDDTQIASAMRQLDMSQCPRDFAVAYVDHLHAWEKAAEIQKAIKQLESDDHIGGVILDEMFHQIFGSDSHPLKDAADAEKRLKAAANDASAEIKATFREVERIAVSYGATLP